MRTYVPALSLMLVALLVACEADPVGPSDSSWFTATVEGVVSTEYQGSGLFSTMPNARRPAAPPFFFLNSRGKGEARNQGFELIRPGEGLPMVGSYRLGSGGEEPAEFSAVYTLQQGNTIHRYAAQAGVLEITTSSAERIEGIFHFGAVLVGACTLSRGGGSCSPLSDPNAPALEVSGSFKAVPEQFVR